MKCFPFSAQDSTIDSVYIFNDYINENSEIKFSDFQKLTLEYGDSIYIPTSNWGGVTPKENLVAGFNFETTLDNRNIVFQLCMEL